MNTDVQPQTLRIFVVFSLILGVLGAGMYWWVPFGIVLSIGGLTFGVVDWTIARRRSLNAWLAIVAILVCLAALCLDINVFLHGWQTMTIGG